MNMKGLVKTLFILFSISGIILYSCATVTIKPIHSTGVAVNNTEEDTDEFWDLIKEVLPGYGHLPSGITYAYYWFDNSIEHDGYAYVYGGKTAFRSQPVEGNKREKVFAFYLDNHEYSGVTIKTKRFDLRPFRRMHAAGIGFWVRGGTGDETVYIGLLDDNKDEKEVQSRLTLRDFGKLDTNWQYFMIPLKAFRSEGKYWDESRKSEVLDTVKWDEINAIRFSTNRGENSPDAGKPVRLYIDQLGIIEDIPGYVDPDEFWANFSSDEPDVLLHDFENGSTETWQESGGPASKITIAARANVSPECGESSLAVTYQLNDWCDAVYDYRANGDTADRRDWTGFWGVRMTVCTKKAYQSFNLQVADAGNELYIASCGVPAGCSDVLIPFLEFHKFPYYQPPDARHDGTFDLDGVISLDIKPAGEGTEGTFLVDNILLTNERSERQRKEPEKKNVLLTVDVSDTVTAHINPGIFGINAQHWDGNLLDTKSIGYVRQVGHNVIRFPGGLSADEYHWKEMLDAKDHNVDIDEFIEFCKATGVEPMITVNFGTGTVEEAAGFVEYVNIIRKAGVRYWEIGNELYGSWHKNHCTAEEYGRRAAQFITAMKNVDSTILVTVVWEIESPWNKTVFNYTRSIADGINVHNYPQESGEENDRALLAAPQALEGIIGRVRRQLEECGEPGKHYQIWLTEWNSVDFNPGPQILGMVNALFVADYLGMLAKMNIEQATYWNIHNSMFVEGGDYGYLSRDDDPNGANLPRPSYWAFRLAAMGLRGILLRTVTDDINVSAYVCETDKKRMLLLINKYSATTVKVPISAVFGGNKVTEHRLLSTSGKGGFGSNSVMLQKREDYSIPPYSITLIEAVLR